MINRKSILGFSSAMTAIVLIGIAVTTTSLNAQAQTADSSQQIRNYLIKAIQALDNGDNSEAVRQLQLATDQMGTFAAVSGQSPTGQNVETIESNNGAGGSNNDGGDGNDDEGEGSEEGEGEDEDEPGDVDSNDEED